MIDACRECKTNNSELIVMKIGQSYGHSSMKLNWEDCMLNNKVELIYLISLICLQGISVSSQVMPSPLSILSSPDDPPKSSISSLNLSSGDENLKICNEGSTLLTENPIPVLKTTANSKCIEDKQASIKSPMKPSYLQSKGSNVESTIPAEESDQSCSSDFHLTPEFVRLGTSKQ
jgi:hypothetical protein